MPLNWKAQDPVSMHQIRHDSIIKPGPKNSYTSKENLTKSHCLGNKPQAIKQSSKQENIPGSIKNSNDIHVLQSTPEQRLSLRPSTISKPTVSAIHIVLLEEECAFKINNTTFYSCPVCTQTFPIFSELQEHIRTHPFTNEEHECDICHKSFSSKKSLLSHKRTHSGKRPFKCEICGKEFKYKGQAIEHNKIHTGEKRHYCDVCDYGTQNKSQLTSHKNLYHKQIDHYVCNICGKDCPSRYLLTTHKVTHGEKEFKCKYCDRAFHQKYNCHAHEKSHSPNRIKVQCEICGNKFAHLNGLKRHKLHMHFGEKKKLHRCEFCQTTVSSLASLKIHRRRHTGDKPFSCDVCDKSFNSKDYLITHKRIHTGEKPFTCHLCNKSFSQRGTLTIHHRSHSGVEPYECATCYKTFATKTVLKTHMKIHV